MGIRLFNFVNLMLSLSKLHNMTIYQISKLQFDYRRNLSNLNYTTNQTNAHIYLHISLFVL